MLKQKSTVDAWTAARRARRPFTVSGTPQPHRVGSGFPPRPRASGGHPAGPRPHLRPALPVPALPAPPGIPVPQALPAPSPGNGLTAGRAAPAAAMLDAARPRPPAPPPLPPGALHRLYAWLDALPPSRRKRHLARDFSDGGEGPGGLPGRPGREPSARPPRPAGAPGPGWRDGQAKAAARARSPHLGSLRSRGVKTPGEGRESRCLDGPGRRSGAARWGGGRGAGVPHAPPPPAPGVP